MSEHANAKALLERICDEPGGNLAAQLVLSTSRDVHGYNALLRTVRERYKELMQPPEIGMPVWLLGRLTHLSMSYLATDLVVSTPVNSPLYRVRTDGGVQALRPGKNMLHHAQKNRRPIGLAGTITRLEDDLVDVSPELLWYDAGDTAHVVGGGISRAYPTHL